MNENLMFFLINIFDMALIIFILAIMPMITRKNLLFGVRIPETASHSPEVKNLKRRYTIWMLLMGLVLVLLCLAQYGFAPQYSLLACILVPLIMIPLQMLIFIPHWRAATRLKADKAWKTASGAVVETRSAAERVRLGAIPWGWYVVSILLVVGSIIWSVAVYKDLPDQMVTHWDFAGNPNGWSAKGPMTVFMLPLFGLFMIGTMIISNMMVFRMKLQINQDNPELSFAQHQEYRKIISAMLGLITLCCGILFAFIQLETIGALPNNPAFIITVIIALCVVIMIPSIYIPIKAGQSGCRLTPHVDANHPLAAQGNVRKIHPGQGDDRFWKLGMFYYNPEDPAILVEDRFGGNGGFNYARPAAIVIVAGLMLIVVATLIVTAVLII